MHAVYNLSLCLFSHCVFTHLQDGGKVMPRPLYPYQTLQSRRIGSRPPGQLQQFDSRRSLTCPEDKVSLPLLVVSPPLAALHRSIYPSHEQVKPDLIYDSLDVRVQQVILARLERLQIDRSHSRRRTGRHGHPRGRSAWSRCEASKR